MKTKYENMNELDAETVLLHAYNALEFLQEQHWRQRSMEEAGRRSSYPRYFPEWEEAWKQCSTVMNLIYDYYQQEEK